MAGRSALAAAVSLVLLGAGVAATAPSGPSASSWSADGIRPVSATTAAGTSYAPRHVTAHDARRGSLTLTPLVTRRRPNIVVIMTDDARDDDLRFMPNVRRLIEDQGVRFVNTFSPQPLCCPARASFLTGQYSHNHHVWSHVAPFGFRALRDQQTLPVWLHQAGYDTVFLGKYLNGYGEQTRRNGQPSLHYVPPGWTDWRGSIDGGDKESRQLDGGTYRYFDTTLNVNGRLEPHQGQYQTFLFSRIAQDVFRAQARSPHPFFAWLSFVAPHHGLPHEADDPGYMRRSNGHRERFRSPARPRWVRGRFDAAIPHAPGYHGEPDVAGKPFFIRDLPPLTAAERHAIREDARQRAESLSLVDDEVASLVQVLKRTGQLDNTYLVFTSDNGYFLGEHRMRQGKILPYEPSLRVPLVIRGPGIPAGQVRTDPFITPDFAPTFLQIAGAARNPIIDGVSMLGVAEHGDRGWRRGVLTETGPRAVRGGRSATAESDNFLVERRGPSPLRFSQGVRTGSYLYVEHASRERELYDLRTDERELHNLVHQPRERRVVHALAHQLDRLRNCVGLACDVPLPRWLRTDHPAPTLPAGSYD
ncbi:MAG: sulfatase family protein [Nocardioidaceae bacterium]